MDRAAVVEQTRQTLVRAGSTFFDSKVQSYAEHIQVETLPLCKWTMENIQENAVAARENQSPLCDDTGIPHIILEIGKNRSISGEFMDAIYEGIAQGLKTLPGRPMAIMGTDIQRVDQSGGLDSRPEAVLPAPVMLRYADEPDRLRLTVLMQGGGPEIRAKTYRIFHKHSMDTVIDEVSQWAREAVGLLGCTPCTLAIGIGRSHYEASSMMLQAMTEGEYSKQTPQEQEITRRVNETQVGPLGLGGENTVLATFMKIGPQRASGVRIVCMRPCCCFEPRRASTDF